MSESLVPMDATTVGDICDRFVKMVMEENSQQLKEQIDNARLKISSMGKIKRFFNFGWSVPITNAEIAGYVYSCKDHTIWSAENFLTRQRHDNIQLAASLAVLSAHPL